MHDFLNGNLDWHKWPHKLRNQYRMYMWNKTARERCQHFDGIQQGINRQRTLALRLLHELASQADHVQHQLDTQQVASIDPAEDPRPKLKILRLLISAGLQTPERDHRHRRRPGSVKCRCGSGTPTIYHISWECKCYQDIRQPIWQYLPERLESLPVCFQWTSIVPSNMQLTEAQIKHIQTILIMIWQKQVQDWYDTTDPDTETPNNPGPSSGQPPNQSDPSSPPEVNNNPPNQPSIKRGHILKLIPTGGVFCCRCGKQTKYQKHQRLKILSKPCAFPDLEPSKWLKEPCFHTSEIRIQEAEKELNQKYNPGNHQLIWNKKIGKNKSKEDYGKLWCAQCGRFWPWSQRHNNKTICAPSSNKPIPPDWVTLLDHYPTTSQANTANVTISSQQVRRRLVGKQRVFTRDSESAPSASGASASSSSLLPRVGVG